MKKIFYALSLAVALLTTSCAKDATEDILNGGNSNSSDVAMTTITVGIDNATRVHLGDENDSYMPLYWSEGDKLSLNGKPDSAALTAEQSGGATATFEIPATLAGQDLQIIYPADVCSGTSHFYLDSEVDYNPAKLAQNQPVLMGFLSAGSTEVKLQHMCGYMRVQLTGNATVKKVMLRTLNHEPISGFHIQTITAEEVSMIDYNKNGLADGYFNSPVTTINCGEGVTLTSEPTNFDFAIPAGYYKDGFALTIIDSNNKQQTVAAYKNNGKDIKAGVMTKMQPLTVNCTKETGIYDYNSFIGFIRTLEKDCWLDNNNALHLRTDVNLKDFDRSDIVKYDDLIFFRADYTTYNNDNFTLFDGHNHTISDYSHTITKNKSALIFNTVLSGMTVQNLTVGSKAGVDADCSAVIKVDNTTGFNYTGTFSYQVLGKVINCTNNANTQIVYTKGTGCRFGVFSGNTDNTILYVENCKNCGNITFTDGAATPTGAIQIGGIASRNNTGSTIKGCTNEGNITVTSNCANHIQVGGVIGYAYANSTISGNTNRGTVTVNTPEAANTQVGGVVGYSASSISNCNNYASVSATDTRGSDNAKIVSRVGGIVGSLADGNSITNCTTSKDPNNASAQIPTITLSTTDTNGWNSVGGIVGYGSTESTTPNVIDGCTNHATVIFAGTGICRMGGISGQTGHLKNCTNYGEVKQTNADCSAQVFIGGIGGSMHWITENCHNYGNVSMVNGGSGDAGGMAGYTTTADAKTYTNCSVDCTVTAPKANNGGIFFGYIAEANITMTGCKAYGKVVLAGTENTVTSDNLPTLIFGESNNGKTIDVTNVTIESTKPAAN